MRRRLWNAVHDSVDQKALLPIILASNELQSNPALQLYPLLDIPTPARQTETILDAQKSIAIELRDSSGFGVSSGHCSRATKAPVENKMSSSVVACPAVSSQGPAGQCRKNKTLLERVIVPQNALGWV